MGGEEKKVVMSPFIHALAGGVGGMIALTCTYPLDIIKTRLQVSPLSSPLSSLLSPLLSSPLPSSSSSPPRSLPTFFSSRSRPINHLIPLTTGERWTPFSKSFGRRESLGCTKDLILDWFIPWSINLSISFSMNGLNHYIKRLVEAKNWELHCRLTFLWWFLCFPYSW